MKSTQVEDSGGNVGALAERYRTAAAAFEQANALANTGPTWWTSTLIYLWFKLLILFSESGWNRAVYPHDGKSAANLAIGVAARMWSSSKSPIAA
ncbi:hypothetical protein [Bradyrhizobium sp. USDA 4529]